MSARRPIQALLVAASVSGLLVGTAAPAFAGSGNATTTYSGKYSNACVGWSGSSPDVLAASSHSESATARGAVQASAPSPLVRLAS